MAFSSLPVLYHIDPQNWHQQSNENQQQTFTQQHESSPSQPPHQQPQQTQQSNGGGGSTTPGSIKPNSMVDRARQAQLPLPEPGLKCPRCESTITKFCYFNNYNLSQPRHFCKTCRRYWTRGGSLRNVPVGGGSRRTAKRSKGKNGAAATITTGSGISSGGSMLRSPAANNSSSTSNSTSLFMSHHNMQNPSMQQLPFLPSLHHHLVSSNPSNIGLNLMGVGGVEMEFPNLLASFEGLRRISGMQQQQQQQQQPYENSNVSNLEFLNGIRLNGGHALQSKPLDMDPQVIDGVASVKIEDSRGVNLTKDFAVLQGNDQQQHHHQLNWNHSNVWSNGDISGYTSSSAASHLL